MEEIFSRYDTDKNTIHSYAAAYERVFESKRYDAIRLLEIGVWAGASLRVWADYFEHTDSEIIGLDINSNFESDTPKIKMMVLDATDSGAVSRLEGQFDIIIDDGSHILRDQMRSFNILKDRVPVGGVYIIEDIQSIENAEILMALGVDSGWTVELSDTRHLKGRWDDIMVIYTKSHVKDEIVLLPK